MFDTSVLKLHEFHDSVIEKSEWHPHGQIFHLYGEFPESEQEKSGFRGYHFGFLGVTEMEIEQKDYTDSSVIGIEISPSDAGFCAAVTVSLDFGDFAMISFLCSDVCCDFYK